MLSRLQFITQPHPTLSSTQLIEEVCKSGVKMVQLRLKDTTEKEIYRLAKEAKLVCAKYGATLILNDYVTIAKDLDLDGVHLGKEDMSPIMARELLGKDKIIGGTANNLEDILRLIDAKVNYIGLGPFRYTSTKKKLSPILGVDGYKNIVRELAKYSSMAIPPIYAIGGITVEDVSSILQTGVFGIAVSGAISNASNLKDSCSAFLIASR